MKKHFNRIFLMGTGLIALLWFLIRVIPKPSRAAYPCQQAAFPIASGFVLWIVFTLGSFGIIRKGKQLMAKSFSIKGVVLLIAGISIILISRSIYFPLNLNAFFVENSFVPTDLPNSPMGFARGVNPGRVVWVHEKEATSWDGSSNYWWSADNTNQAIVDSMAKHTIQWLTNENDLAKAYDMIFRYFNRTNDKGDVAYTAGEKIAIKVNMNNSKSPDSPDNKANTTPQVLLSYIRHLVNIVGVAESNILVYDKSRSITMAIYTTITHEYPGIQFMDDNGYEGKNNWRKYEIDGDAQINWSEELTLEREGGNATFLPKGVSQADYIINLANLKGHSLTGVTMCAKNHLGTFYSYDEEYDYYGPKAAGVHPYIAAHDHGTCGGSGNWDFCASPMGSYNSLVDLMGHKDIGKKTLLFIIDALYCSTSQGGTPTKWSMAPFNNDWTSSLFISQDGVAIESVGLDFLRSEPTQNNVYGSVDNYLHEASQADNPPSGTKYDPEGEGSILFSLGVHEHWNNAADMQYTRNLETDDGIELVNGAQETSKLGGIYPDRVPGTYPVPLTINLYTAKENASIYYTLDGSNPDENSGIFDGTGITIEESAIIKAIAYKDGYNSSPVFSFSYTIYPSSSAVTTAKEQIAKIFPNPVGDNLFIEVDSEIKPDVCIYSETGRLMYYAPFDRSPVNFSRFAKGTYFLKLELNNEIIFHETIIKR